MPQHDYIIADDYPINMLPDMNALFMAIATQNSGDSEPNPTYPLQWWADTLTGYLKQRNVANDAWLVRWDLTKGQLATLYSPTFGGQVNLPTTTFINGNAVATLVAPIFSGNSVFETLTAWSSVSLPASTTIGAISSTELSYLDGVTSPIQSQLNARQATLVSGTNIKTINGATLVGSGDLVITQNPSAVFSSSQTFTTSGSFTVPSNVTTLMVCGAHAGAGGGGAGGCDIDITTYGGGGGGGAASAWGSQYYVTVISGQVITVTIGSGGSGGAGGTDASIPGNGGTGGAGGDTLFGSIRWSGSSGSSQGKGGTYAGGVSAGSGGGGGGGSIATDGGSGGTGAMTTSTAGTAGAAASDGIGIYTPATGGAGGGTSSGGAAGIGGTGVVNGSNGVAGSTKNSGAGGAGGAGRVIVYW